MDGEGLLEVESGLRHEMDSGLGHEIHKPVPSNRTGDSLPWKESVPSSLFLTFFTFQGNSLMRRNYLPITIFKKSA